MNVAQLIASFRIEVFDLNEPYLFSDTEVATWLTEAQEEAAIRRHLIEESESAHLTRFEIREGVLSYPLDSRMLYVEAADLRQKGSDVISSWALGIMTEREMNKRDRFWRVSPGEPSAVIQADTKLYVNALPQGEYTLDVRGYRLPKWSLGVVPVAETLATGSVTLTGGSSGSVDTVKVNGVDILGAAVAYNTSLTQTAADVATQINSNTDKFTATSAGAVVTVSDIADSGVLHNGQTVTVTVTGITATTTALTGGVDAVVNTLEINVVNHRHLVKWVIYRAFDRLDSETFDKKRAYTALAEFEDVFGKRPDADYWKERSANNPHINRGYP